MYIVVAGGTGLIGKALIKTLLHQQHRVLLLTRHPENVRDNSSSLRIESWDASKSGSLAELLDGSDAVINLTGESIAAKRWTQIRKSRILQSRISATRALVGALKQTSRKPSVLLNASAVGYYGHVPEGDVTEIHHRGEGFLADVCAAWEAEACKAHDAGIRVIFLRTGIVLDVHGGALQKMLLPFRFFLGGPLGSGRQWFPWIDLYDEIEAIAFAMNNEHLEGPVNLTAPVCVWMSEFCTLLGKVLHRPSRIHVPGWALKLALGEMAEPLLLEGQKAVPQQLLEAGFAFRYSNLEDALKHVFA